MTQPAPAISAPGQQRLPGEPIAAARQDALDTLIAAYGGHTYRLLVALADRLSATIAYVDRPTIEAHLDRPLTDTEWVATRRHFAAMDLDDHVGDHGTFRTDWIDTVLVKAGIGNPDPGAAEPPS